MSGLHGPGSLGRIRPPRLLRAPRKAAGKMNILAPVRRDRVLTELPQVGARATSGFWLRWVWAGSRRHQTSYRLGPSPAAQLGLLLLGGLLPIPRRGLLGCGKRARNG